MPANKPETCGAPGCNQGPATGATLYNVGHGPRCVRHFTGEAARTTAKKGEPK